MLPTGGTHLSVARGGRAAGGLAGPARPQAGERERERVGPKTAQQLKGGLFELFK